jgi:hypothetical protein
VEARIDRSDERGDKFIEEGINKRILSYKNHSKQAQETESLNNKKQRK